MEISSVDELLSTTRAVRKRLDLDRPVGPRIIADCLRLALQAPTGGNRQALTAAFASSADEIIGTTTPHAPESIARMIIAGSFQGTRTSGALPAARIDWASTGRSVKVVTPC